LQKSTRRSADNKQLIRVELLIETNNPEEAQALLSAIRPDDKTAPSWLTIREKQDGHYIRIVVEAEDTRRLGSVRNTVDEILEFLYSLLKSIEETAKTLKQAD